MHMAKGTLTEGQWKARSGPATWYKRPFDLFFLTAVHVILLPIWLLLWSIIPLLIWLEDRGPIFYPQLRVGKKGRTFHLLKFRTMIKDAEKIGPGWTSENDARITRVGRLLRRTAMDELPQVINILRGHISFVGPRALPVTMHEEMVIEEPRFSERLQVRPGLTGLAQTHLSRHCPPRKRLRYDLLYMKKRGFWLDVKLIFHSAWLTLCGRWGADSRKAEPPSGSYSGNS